MLKFVRKSWEHNKTNNTMKMKKKKKMSKSFHSIHSWTRNKGMLMMSWTINSKQRFYNIKQDLTEIEQGSKEIKSPLWKKVKVENSQSIKLNISFLSCCASAFHFTPYGSMRFTGMACLTYRHWKNKKSLNMFLPVL